jgi:hypothetical protein
MPESKRALTHLMCGKRDTSRDPLSDGVLGPMRRLAVREQPLAAPETRFLRRSTLQSLTKFVIVKKCRDGRKNIFYDVSTI